MLLSIFVHCANDSASFTPDHHHKWIRLFLFSLKAYFNRGSQFDRYYLVPLQNKRTILFNEWFSKIRKGNERKIFWCVIWEAYERILQVEQLRSYSKVVWISRQIVFQKVLETLLKVVKCWRVEPQKKTTSGTTRDFVAKFQQKLFLTFFYPFAQSWIALEVYASWIALQVYTYKYLSI